MGKREEGEEERRAGGIEMFRGKGKKEYEVMSVKLSKICQLVSFIYRSYLTIRGIMSKA